MGQLNISENLFLERIELQKMIGFVQQYGYETFLSNYIGTYGIFKSQDDVDFNYFKVTSPSTPSQYLQIQEGWAFCKRVDTGRVGFIYTPAAQITLPQDSNWYWIKIGQNYSPVEEPIVSISATGVLNASNSDGNFTTLFRGQPNFPHKIKFYDSTYNLQVYEVVNVVDDNNLVLSGTFTAETNLQFSVVGTFTRGITIDPSLQEIFLYDSTYDFTVGEGLVLETSPGVPPTIIEDQEFLIYRVSRTGLTTYLIQDYRSNFFRLNAEYDQWTLPAPSQNPLVGIEKIIYENTYDTQQSNVVELSWGFKGLTYSTNSQNDTLTITSGYGGAYKNSAAVQEGDFDGWRLYFEDPNTVDSRVKFYDIISCTLGLTTGEVILQLDSLQTSDFLYPVLQPSTNYYQGTKYSIGTANYIITVNSVTTDITGSTPSTNYSAYSRKILIVPNVEGVEVTLTPSYPSWDDLMFRVPTTPGTGYNLNGADGTYNIQHTFISGTSYIVYWKGSYWYLSASIAVATSGVDTSPGVSSIWIQVSTYTDPVSGQTGLLDSPALISQCQIKETFPVNAANARLKPVVFAQNIYTDPNTSELRDCWYRAVFRYKNFKSYSPYAPLVSSSTRVLSNASYYIDEVGEDRHYLSSPMYGTIVLKQSPTSYTNTIEEIDSRLNVIDTGEIFGVNLRTIPNARFKLQVGTDKQYQLFQSSTLQTLTSSIEIGFIGVLADETTPIKNGSAFYLHFTQPLVFNPITQTINLVAYSNSSDYNSASGGSTIFQITQFDAHFFNKQQGVIYEVIYDASLPNKWVVNKANLTDPVGTIKMWVPPNFVSNPTISSLTDYFDSTGLGKGLLTGWALCNGNNGTITMTGRVPVQVDPSDSSSLDPLNAVALTGGEKTHTLLIGEIPSHNHAVNDPGHFHSPINGLQVNQPAVGGSGTSTPGLGGTFGSTASATTGITLEDVGGSGAHENMMPFITIPFIQRIS